MNLAKVLWAFRAMVYGLLTKVGMPSYIGKPVFISRISRITFGKRVRIYPGMRAEILGGNGCVEIGDNVSIGQNFHVVAANEKLLIGSNVTISANVFISNCDHTFDDEYKQCLELPLKNKTTSIGNASFIGYGAVILAGTHIGRHCVVGANSVVRGRFPDNTMLAGNPACVVKVFDTTQKKWVKA